jgi:hypothetical protein
VTISGSWGLALCHIVEHQVSAPIHDLLKLSIDGLLRRPSAVRSCLGVIRLTGLGPRLPFPPREFLFR